jgi:hypothetical protein
MVKLRVKLPSKLKLLASTKVRKGITNVDFEDSNFFKHQVDKNHENYKNIDNFLQFMAICHTVIVEEKNGKTTFNVFVF